MLSDYLNSHVPEGWQKPQLVAALSGTLDRATVYKYLAGNHPRNPAESVLQAFAAVLPGASVVDLRAAANVSAGAEDPWIPPAAANRLTQPQRRALEAFIKAFVGPAEEGEPGFAEAFERDGYLEAETGDAELTSAERLEVQSYVDRLYASGHKDLAGRVAASLVINSASETASKSTRD